MTIAFLEGYDTTNQTIWFALDYINAFKMELSTIHEFSMAETGIALVGISTESTVGTRLRQVAAAAAADGDPLPDILQLAPLLKNPKLNLTMELMNMYRYQIAMVIKNQNCGYNIDQFARCIAPFVPTTFSTASMGDIHSVMLKDLAQFWNIVFVEYYDCNNVAWFFLDNVNAEKLRLPLTPFNVCLQNGYIMLPTSSDSKEGLKLRAQLLLQPGFQKLADIASFISPKNMPLPSAAVTAASAVAAVAGAAAAASASTSTAASTAAASTVTSPITAFLTTKATTSPLPNLSGNEPFVDKTTGTIEYRRVYNVLMLLYREGFIPDLTFSSVVSKLTVKKLNEFRLFLIRRNKRTPTTPTDELSLFTLTK
ncbi:UNVERIFIED_CONTAM: hypothetical protein HDU68_012297 [Siphonaria sp. JEL0065]|nr:hypothetical protein HDU68_012297 [Siphonaria sp. JEL0065]